MDRNKALHNSDVSQQHSSIMCVCLLFTIEFVWGSVINEITMQRSAYSPLSSLQDE